jgi:lipoprotein-anchoring transpeptidase ErfK/SrfK
MLKRFLLALVFALAASPAFAGVSVVVDISTQTMSVTIDGFEEFQWPVSTGRKGYSTPVGKWHPTRMEWTYFSKKFDDAPMPYSIFFVGGYAIHGTEHLRSLGTPVSHGCVRLHPDNAALLYDIVSEYGPADTTIRIKN